MLANLAADALYAKLPCSGPLTTIKATAGTRKQATLGILTAITLRFLAASCTPASRTSAARSTRFGREGAAPEGTPSHAWNNPATLHDPDGDLVFIPIIIAGAVWADRAYTAYSLYRDTQKVRSGEMSEVEFVAEHAADFLPGKGALKAGQTLAGVFKRTGGEVAETAAKKVGPQVPSAATKHADDSPRMRGDCSFSEATPVATAEGLKPIGQLKLGDRVLARSETTGAYGFKPVAQVFKHHDPVKLRLTLEDPATHAVETIETTPEHPFHVPGRGFVEAAALKAGDPVSRAPSLLQPELAVGEVVGVLGELAVLAGDHRGRAQVVGVVVPLLLVGRGNDLHGQDARAS